MKKHFFALTSLVVQKKQASSFKQKHEKSLFFYLEHFLFRTFYSKHEKGTQI